MKGLAASLPWDKTKADVFTTQQERFYIYILRTLSNKKMGDELPKEEV